jgi:hypothetical protein
VAGKPYIVSEVNHQFPAEHAAEDMAIMAAYAAFQDWDGVFWYTFEHSDPSAWLPMQPSYFEFRPDPAKMTQIAAGALMFLRSDVRPAEKTNERTYSLPQVYESLRLPPTERPFFTLGFPLAIPLQHGVRIASFERESGGPPPSEAGNPIRSDTKELAWYVSDDKTGMVSVDTPRSQALIGFVQAHPLILSNLSADVRNGFCALVLSSLDGEPLARSRHMLLAAGSRVANTGMEWNEAHTSLVDWGTVPTLIEPVIGTITLRSIAGAKEVEATPLDSASRPLGASCPVQKTAQGWEMSVGKPATTWYLIRVER